jgi:hypothetical protein
MFLVFFKWQSISRYIYNCIYLSSHQFKETDRPDYHGLGHSSLKVLILNFDLEFLNGVENAMPIFHSNLSNYQ